MWFINQVVIKKNHKDVLYSWSYIPGGGFSSPDISGIKEDIAIIQSTLEQKLSEGRSVSTELDKAKKEKKSLQQENLRLNHRIAYLEDQTTELQDGLKQVIGDDGGDDGVYIDVGGGVGGDGSGSGSGSVGDGDDVVDGIDYYGDDVGSKDCVVGAGLPVADSEHHRHHPGDDEAGGEQRQQRGGELRGEPDQRQSGPCEETPRGDRRGEGVHLQVSQR